MTATDRSNLARRFRPSPLTRKRPAGAIRFATPIAATTAGEIFVDLHQSWHMWQQQQQYVETRTAAPNSSDVCFFRIKGRKKWWALLSLFIPQVDRLLVLLLGCFFVGSYEIRQIISSCLT